MTVKELLEYGNLFLKKEQNKLLLSYILKINQLEISLHLNDIVNNELINDYKEKVQLINKGEPLQYVLSNACFYGYNYYVNKNVLIPRFETEELVYETLKYLKKYIPSGKVLDLCTGSGCIGLTLKQELPPIDMTLSDISQDALDVACINKNKYNVDCQIILSDLFENINDKYDCIISNPPYIGYDEEVMDIVKNNEPSLALYADNNGLAIYERILKKSKDYLNKKSLIAFELNSNKSQLIYELAKNYFPDAKLIIKKDNYQRDRMLFILNDIE